MPDEKSPIERAEEAVCEQIVQRAGASAANDQRAGELKKLAEGVAAMKHGPQGGAYSNTYEGSYVSSTSADNHTTDHEGESRPRPTPGFSADA